jgi:formate dehydrogenase major subunit
MDDAEVVILWGSNARAAHPIFFHRVIRAVRRGAQLFCVDPRRSESAEWADLWLGIDVGTDIALSNTMAREILAAGLENRAFIEHSTLNFEEYAQSVEEWTLERGEEVTGVPGDAIRTMAHAYARADRAQLCWTLGITEHHNATDNVLSLINLALLCGHVGRYGSGLVPLRGQNNVQGGGDMGAIPNKLPGFQDVESDELRGRFEAKWGTLIPSRIGRHLTLMFEAMEEGHLRGLYVIGENPAESEADVNRARALLEGLDFMVVQDIFLTRTAQMADVVLPAAADWCEAEGTVTSSERRVQRVRPALRPPGEARTDSSIICAMAASMGHDWGMPSAEEVWDELRSLSPMHGGMSYRRLEENGGLQWPCPNEDHPGELFLHSRLWEDPPVGPLAPFFPVEWVPPADRLTDEYPVRLTTGRHLDSYNTGVQSGATASPLRTGGTLDISPEDSVTWEIIDGEEVRVTSRRGSITVPARVDDSLRPGLVFMSVHFPEQADINKLTIEAWDPKSGTAEFKATAVRVEKHPAAVG